MTNLEAAARVPTPGIPAPGLPAPGIPARPSLAGYRILRAWQRALDVAARAHRLAHTLPADEQHALAADLRRAGAAVPTHIAAGNLSYDPAEHRRALLATQTALARVETLALLAEHLALAAAPDVAALLAESADTLRLVRGLARATGAGAGTTMAASAVSENTPAHRVVATIVPTPAIAAPLAHPPARATRTRRSPRTTAAATTPAATTRVAIP